MAASSFDIYCDRLLLAQDLQPSTVADLCKLAMNDIMWAIEERGRCTVCDDSGRDIYIVHHGDHLNKDHR